MPCAPSKLTPYITKPCRHTDWQQNMHCIVTAPLAGTTPATRCVHVLPWSSYWQPSSIKQSSDTHFCSKSKPLCVKTSPYEGVRNIHYHSLHNYTTLAFLLLGLDGHLFGGVGLCFVCMPKSDLHLHGVAWALRTICMAGRSSM